MGRKPFAPTPGEIYENRGGGKYLCQFFYKDTAGMINVNSGWDFEAHGCGIYPDGKIDWDYSTKGRFEQVPRRD